MVKKDVKAKNGPESTCFFKSFLNFFTKIPSALKSFGKGLKSFGKSLKSIGKAIWKFILEIVSELKRVVYPTKGELIENSIVVLVFVTIMMVFITVIDFGIGQGVMAIFTK
ncbi:MAG: preprotein translocase subunit SecE [Bifidobacteriaceae bacterium]|jgi:preprotein translocase subunit SecE|nr:preprotein translocase subunit SecE [Bifidobacteriaceae bacterium]